MFSKSNHCSFILLFLAIGVINSCNHNSSSQGAAKKGPCVKTASLPLKYAKGFSVDYYSGFKVITVRDVLDTSRPAAQYVMLPAGKPAPVGFENAITIQLPVRKVACVSTSHVAGMVKLGLMDSLAAVTNVTLLYDSTIVKKVEHKEIADLGNDEINFEELVQLAPSFVFTSGKYDGGDKLKLKLDALHIKSVIDLDYKEQSPLGRAEWLKFMAAFYGREQEADSMFTEMEKNYLALKDKVKSISKKPGVFCNLPFKEIWYMPCGENYIALLIADAGADFLWKDSKTTNGMNLNLDYEMVYAKAANADFWINLGFANSLKEIKAADKKNALFKAYKTGHVYNYNKRNTAAGGFDFWETGGVNPDKILADLIEIFHPEVLPGRELYYYQKLE